MTPHKQLINHDPDNGQFGDCHRTCFAMILDLHPTEVPHFNDGVFPDTPGDAPEAQRAERMIQDFLLTRGLASFSIPFPGEYELDDLLRCLAVWAPDTPLILGGTSAIGVGHSVVVFRGHIHNPSANALIGPMSDGYWWITALSAGPGAATQAIAA